MRVLADIRTVPKSRHNPQFAQENLKPALEAAGIEYHWFRDLGGLRHTRKDSINTGWRNASFRGYADYMQTPEFAAALDDLLKSAPQEHTAIMCAEAVPWRCHRSLVADALTVRGIPVEDITYSASGKEPAAAAQDDSVCARRGWAALVSGGGQPGLGCRRETLSRRPRLTRAGILKGRCASVSSCLAYLRTSFLESSDGGIAGGRSCQRFAWRATSIRRSGRRRLR